MLHRLNVDHPGSAVVFAGTGLPHTMGRLVEVGVTHSDRLFVETRIPLQLEEADARLAILQPAHDAGADWEPAALDAVLEASNRYPAHLQYFAQAVWRHAPGPVVDLAAAWAAIPAAAEQLTMRSLEPRWDVLSEREAELVAAIAINDGRATARQLASPSTASNGAGRECAKASSRPATSTRRAAASSRSLCPRSPDTP